MILDHQMPRFSSVELGPNSWTRELVNSWTRELMNVWTYELMNLWTHELMKCEVVNSWAHELNELNELMNSMSLLAIIYLWEAISPSKHDFADLRP